MHTPFRLEILERFKLPWRYFAFNTYFAFIVIGYGGLGIFIKLYQICTGNETNGYTIAQDMATYGIAIIAASIVDINLSLNIKSRPSLAIWSFVVGGISFLLMILSYKINSYWAVIPGLLSVLLALAIWVLAYADNENLSDSSYFEKMRGKEVGHGNNWE